MLLTMTTPLAERIDRWATSGKAKSIPLHPSDYYVLSSANLVDKISEKYSLENILSRSNVWVERMVSKTG